MTLVFISSSTIHKTKQNIMKARIKDMEKGIHPPSSILLKVALE
jgi:hypothetical protein